MRARLTRRVLGALLGVSVGPLRMRGDTIRVTVSVSAEQRCPDAQLAWADRSFDYLFARRSAEWRLVSETPDGAGWGRSSSSSARCVPQPRELPYPPLPPLSHSTASPLVPPAAR